MRILRANALVAGKMAVLPTLLQGGIQNPLQLEYRRWIDMKADNLNRGIEDEFHRIRSSCIRIKDWLR